MNKLRKTIRQILLESAVLVDDQIIAAMEKEDLIFVINMEPPYSGAINLLRRGDYDEEYGDFDPNSSLGVIKLGATTLEDTMQVSYSNITHSLRYKGFGRLLYNVALMACSDEQLWLVADRNDVSTNAQRIWQTWIKYPELYDMEQMDHDTIGGDYFLTDDKDDDMVQNSFNDDQWEPDAGISDRLPDEAWVSKSDQLQKDSWYFYSPQYKKQFLDSGLTKRFMMKDKFSFSDKLEYNELLYYPEDSY